jgi:RHS repeat-associated protein
VTVLDGNGTPRTVNESLYGNPWTFTGRRLDGETGLMQYRERMYDTGLGRFISRDPIGYEGGGLGLYEYCGGMPGSATDPFGLVKEKFVPLPEKRGIPTTLGADGENVCSISITFTCNCVNWIAWAIPYTPSRQREYVINTTSETTIRPDADPRWLSAWKAPGLYADKIVDSVFRTRSNPATNPNDKKMRIDAARGHESIHEKDCKALHDWLVFLARMLEGDKRMHWTWDGCVAAGTAGQNNLVAEGTKLKAVSTAHGTKGFDGRYGRAPGGVDTRPF